MRYFLSRRVDFSLRKCLFLALIFSTAFILYSIYFFDYRSFDVFPFSGPRPPQATYRCERTPVPEKDGGGDGVDVHADAERAALLEPRVLLIADTPYSKLGRQIAELFEAARFEYQMETSTKSFPALTVGTDRGRFAVVVFESVERYFAMNKWHRELLDKYLREYNVGLIGFIRSRDETYSGAQFAGGYPVLITTNVPLQDYHINHDSPVLRILKPGQVHRGPLMGKTWTVFQANNASGFESVSWSRSNDSVVVNSTTASALTTVLLDKGGFDGIRRVLFGATFQHLWVHRPLFLDAISFLSHGVLSLPLERYLQVDIDDIFVADRGTRMTPNDVRALLEAQDRLRKLVKNFRFNLGFSGKSYKRGYPEEAKGDEMLVWYAHEFWWFCHMWSHRQPHLFDNITALEIEMRLNKEFAEKHHLQVDSGYSIAPHHSGVYPVHEELYDAWKSVWGISVTSTEEYPHLRPARFRRGFIYRDIMVLPRQTCGLYTHTNHLHRYPGGPSRLEASIHGGELFQLFLTNRINVFMTHFSNYGNDRLALYAFETVIRFVRCWTNIRLQTIPPRQLAEKYFEFYPDERDPLWQNPCNDKRHEVIWSKSKSCNNLPHFLVIGPQKTGTTALHQFLLEHPYVVSNTPSEENFEEIQFFNKKNYHRGLDWYLSHFSSINATESGVVVFEKSATYFDAEQAPRRVKALLPKANIVAIIINPAKRAYSWYQHQRSHGDEAAANYSFEAIIRANDTAPKSVRDLRNRCLLPGLYARHLERWLQYYPPQQLIIVDGDELRVDPILVMNRIQRLLNITPFIDYKDHLKFEPRKGFYCALVSSRQLQRQERQLRQLHQLQPSQQQLPPQSRCLGQSKGRKYPPISAEALNWLRQFYLPHNVALSRLLHQLSLPIPRWLRHQLAASGG